MRHLSVGVLSLVLAPSLVVSQDVVDAIRVTHPDELIRMSATRDMPHYYSELVVTPSHPMMVKGQDIWQRAFARKPLFDAIRSGDKSKVLSILRKPDRVDLNHRELWLGETFLIEAIRANQVEIVGILLDHGADPNLREIIGAGYDGTSRDVLLLGDTPLAAAVRRDSIEMVRLLIKHGVELAKNPYVLHWSKSIGMVRLLLQKGAPVDGLDSYGATYLQTAANRKELQEIAKLLIDKGAKVDVTDDFGGTPLHRVETVEVARLLIKKGANVNAADKEGLTPLHLASFRGARIDLARLLIVSGAKVNARNNFGYSPLDFLVADWYSHNYELALLLVAHGAEINDSLVQRYGLVQVFEKIKKQIK